MHKITATTLKTAFIITLALCLTLPQMAFSASVGGRYLRGSGTTITLELSVGKPAPSSIIVEQSVGSQNKIKNVIPAAKKVSGNGKVKWLLKNPRPGKKQFTIKLHQSLKGVPRGVIRFKDPATGKFMETSVRP